MRRRRHQACLYLPCDVELRTFELKLKKRAMDIIAYVSSTFLYRRKCVANIGIPKWMDHGCFPLTSFCFRNLTAVDFIVSASFFYIDFQ